MHTDLLQLQVEVAVVGAGRVIGRLIADRLPELGGDAVAALASLQSARSPYWQAWWWWYGWYGQKDLRRSKPVSVQSARQSYFIF